MSAPREVKREKAETPELTTQLFQLSGSEIAAKSKDILFRYGFSKKLIGMLNINTGEITLWPMMTRYCEAIPLDFSMLYEQSEESKRSNTLNLIEGRWSFNDARPDSIELSKQELIMTELCRFAPAQTFYTNTSDAYTAAYWLLRLTQKEHGNNYASPVPILTDIKNYRAFKMSISADSKNDVFTRFDWECMEFNMTAASRDSKFPPKLTPNLPPPLKEIHKQRSFNRPGFFVEAGFQKTIQEKITAWLPEVKNEVQKFNARAAIHFFRVLPDAVSEEVISPYLNKQDALTLFCVNPLKKITKTIKKTEPTKTVTQATEKTTKKVKIEASSSEENTSKKCIIC